LLQTLLPRCARTLRSKIPDDTPNAPTIREAVLDSFVELFLCDGREQENRLDVYEVRFNLAFRARWLDAREKETNRLRREEPLPLADGEQYAAADEEVGRQVAAALTGVAAFDDPTQAVAIRELKAAVEWTSADNIRVYVTSALAQVERGQVLALKAASKDGFSASMPVVTQHEGEEVSNETGQEEFEPWTVWPRHDVHLDGTDPLAAASVARRIQFTREMVALCGLVPADPFGREWKQADGTVWARSEAWGSTSRYRSEETDEGNRLLCGKEFLSEVLRAAVPNL